MSPFNHEQKESPLNPIPPVVWLLFLPMAAMELVLSAGASGMVGGPAAVGWRIEALERFSFSPQMFHWMLAQGHFPPEHLIRAVTYPFVNGAFTQALFVAVFLLALGKMVAEVFRPVAVIAVFVAGTLAGAATYMLLPAQDVQLLWFTIRGNTQPLYGGFPAVYALIGAFTFILWQRLGAVQANQYRAFTLIGFLLGIQILFGLIFGGSWQTLAEIAGFAAGFLLSFVVAPGGFRGVLARIRDR